MKTRFKITFTVTIDYEVNPENYPGCSTDEERLALDLKNAEDDPFMMIANDADWKLTGEIVKEGGAA